MSHFSVIVATKTSPAHDPDVLTKVLQPYHEYSSTGTFDEYVLDENKTEEYRKEYSEKKEKMLRLRDGTLRSPYDNEFYRLPTPAEEEYLGASPRGTGCGPGPDGKGLSWTSGEFETGKYHTRIQFVPEGAEEVEIKVSDQKTFLEWSQDYSGRKVYPDTRHPTRQQISGSDAFKWGYILLDESGEVESIVEYDNPNSKWDYWQIGGRYCRKFVPKLQSLGAATSLQEKLSWEWEYEKGEKPVGVDSIRVSHLDKIEMKRLRVADRQKIIDDSLVKSGLTPEHFDIAYRVSLRVHKEWMEIPDDQESPRGVEYKQWAKDKGNNPFHDILVDKLSSFDLPEIPEGISAEEWIAAAPYLTGFAFLKDGVWSESGKMGWFGSVRDEKEPKAWEQEFQELVDKVPEDWFLTVVDCHI